MKDKEAGTDFSLKRDIYSHEELKYIYSVAKKHSSYGNDVLLNMKNEEKKEKK